MCLSRGASRGGSGGAANAGLACLLEYFTSDRIAELSAAIDVDKDMDLGYAPLPRSARGERFPVPDPSLRQRLDPRPESDVDFVHAIFDALARQEADGYTALRDRGASPLKTVLSAGGGARNMAFSRIRERLLKRAHGDFTFAKAVFDEASVGAAILCCLEGASLG